MGIAFCISAKMHLSAVVMFSVGLGAIYARGAKSVQFNARNRCSLANSPPSLNHLLFLAFLAFRLSFLSDLRFFFFFLFFFFDFPLRFFSCGASASVAIVTASG